jgi:phage antirepressor YoqD-like protein
LEEREMRNIAICGDRRMTVKEVAQVTGAAYSTVAAYAQKAGWTENGKQTLLDERQVALIVEAMKQGHAGGPNNAAGTLQTSLEGVETTQSRAVRIAVLAQRQHEIDLQITAELEAEIADLKAKAEADAPKVEFFDQVADSRDALQMRDVAAALNMPGWGRNKIFRYLRGQGVLDERNVPYREYQDRRYFRVIEQKWTDSDGETHISLKTLVYQRGVDFIRGLLKQGGAA